MNRPALSLALLIALPAAAESGRLRSPTVYPEQRLPLVFDHKIHLENGSDCLTCHDSARKSEKVQDLLLPRGSSKEHPDCDPCHDIEAARKGKAKKDDPPSRCADCHPGFDETAMREPPKLRLPSAHLVFSHKTHIDAIKQQAGGGKPDLCKPCHGAMTDVSLATTFQLPKMETCLECHDNTHASSDCRTCHITAPSGRIVINFTSGLLRPMQGNPYGIDHGPNYEFTHGTRAKLDRQGCMVCHQESECLQCHDALMKPLSVHPNDYIALHPIEARMDTPKCDSCHRYQSFCAPCHERAGVGMSAAAYFRARNVRVHPDYTVWVVQVGPRHHGIQASRNIQECISCHRQEDCLPCHSSQSAAVDGIAKRYGGIGKDPHPDGFAKICKTLFSRNPRPCRLCHVAGSADLTTCGGS